ncbi:FadR/GntR family transcriptional regulator [Pseudonocardia humida]|uniref:FadR family transcriptional regulator n=1 Tax=Pseudonocardia humida TaxID=2800819 RepID=A0ABT1A3V1_9PSEU|nr:FCD domain-containing protein [Pseudonocardia humida]MCO1657688.1 FadR family transcriptional regulator [Pseudonocardia humida]
MTTPDTSKWTLSADSRRPRPEVIEDRIRQLIDSGELPAGELLPNEHELARRFGVGRTSVRAALQRLQLGGLVDVERGRGWLVVARSPTEAEDSPTDEERDRRFELAQLAEVRLALETTATGLAAHNATREELGRIIDADEAHRRARDADEMLETDERFHALIVDAAHNRILRDMYAMLIPELREFRRGCFADGTAGKQSSDGHGLVVQFLKNRDEAGARTAMASHVLTFASRLGGVVRVGLAY